VDGVDVRALVRHPDLVAHLDGGARRLEVERGRVVGVGDQPRVEDRAVERVERDHAVEARVDGEERLLRARGRRRAHDAEQQGGGGDQELHPGEPRRSGGAADAGRG
jgi:hypothetical protein